MNVYKNNWKTTKWAVLFRADSNICSICLMRLYMCWCVCVLVCVCAVDSARSIEIGNVRSTIMLLFHKNTIKSTTICILDFRFLEISYSNYGCHACECHRFGILSNFQSSQPKYNVVSLYCTNTLPKSMRNLLSK